MKFSFVVSLLASFASAADSVEVVANAAGLTSLLAAIEKVNLTKTVIGLTNVTIFAPTNQAFDDVNAFAAKNNLTITDDLLTKVLQLHIVPSVVYSSIITSSKSSINAATLSKDSLIVSAINGSVTVQSPGNVTATVVTADVLVSQGVVHVIDKVLLPDLSQANVVARSSALAHGSLLALTSLCLLVVL